MLRKVYANFQVSRWTGDIKFLNWCREFVRERKRWKRKEKKIKENKLWTKLCQAQDRN